MTAAIREMLPAAEKKEASKGGLFMMVIAVAFLVALPQAAAAGANRLFHWNLAVQSPAFQALTGGFKLCVVLGYLALIRRVPEIRRVFQYHGAEHKTISTYEANELLDRLQCPREDDAASAMRNDFFGDGRADERDYLDGGRRVFAAHRDQQRALLDNVIFFFEKLPFLPVLAGHHVRDSAGFCALLHDRSRCACFCGRASWFKKSRPSSPTTISSRSRSHRSARRCSAKTASKKGDAKDDVVFSNYEAIAQAERLRAA